MAQITFDTDDPSDVVLVRTIVRELDGPNGAPLSPKPTDGAPEGDAAETSGSVEADDLSREVAEAKAMVDKLYERFGKKNRDLVRMAAELVQRDGSFTLETLAAEENLTPAQARSWKFGLGRSLKRIAKEMPTAPPLFEKRWNGKQNVYTMPPAVIQAVLEQRF